MDFFLNIVFLVVLRILREGLPLGDEATQYVVGIHRATPFRHAPYTDK